MAPLAITKLVPAALLRLLKIQLLVLLLARGPSSIKAKHFVEEHFIDALNDEDRDLREHDNFSKIPGLYDSNELITPVQGEAQFERLVLPPAHLNSSYQENLLEPTNQTIRLVQFYMATCPDCQGFSPYFKRFVGDVGSNWNRLLRIIVVNCNDERNIPLCWSQNPQLKVPMVRWYNFPLVQAKVQPEGNAKAASRSANETGFIVNWSHRDKNYRQRRDYISLRRGTLDFINAILKQLSEHPGNSSLSERRKRHGQNELNLRHLYDKLPMRWHLLEPLEEAGTREKLFEQIQQRGKECRKQLKALSSIAGSNSHTSELPIENLLVIEAEGSYIGRTIAADWSNWTCTSDDFTKADSSDPVPLLVHHTSEISLVPEEDFVQGAGPYLFRVSEEPEGDLKFVLIAVNSTKPSNRLSKLHRRSEAQTTKRPEEDHLAMLEMDNINWGPPQMYPLEESVRFKFNTAILDLLMRVYQPDGKLWGQILTRQVPGRDGDNWGEIKQPPKNSSGLVLPKDEDLSRLLLTDYYRLLSEMIQKTILSKAELSGFELLAINCWLTKLIQHFPFQGKGHGRTSQAREQNKAVALTYLTNMEKAFTAQLAEKLPDMNIDCKTTEVFNFSEEERKRLSSVKLQAKELEEIQTTIRREHDVGLPAAGHFKWSYCKGSKEFLRGYTCSLWVLFHTLTVHEYLDTNKQHGNSHRHVYTNEVAEPNQYEYNVDYSKKAGCDPKNPEPALLESTSEQLFEDAPKFVLGNIINFVRYFLPCTNCAAHFNCMTRHSKFNFVRPEFPSDHLLWLWEAHNRVNIRTRRTHSEDPEHPKHVFPSYEACPSCYLVKPEQNSTSIDELESLKFNRAEVIQFLVSRYRRSAILNNKIRIEDLFRSQPQASGRNLKHPS